MSAEKDNRCWPGYEPVPGKKPNSQGSCRPKAESKLTGSQKSFRTKRKKQLDEWQEEHPGTRRQAAQHLSAPGKKKAPAKGKKASAKSKTGAKTSARKKSAAKRKSTSARTGSRARARRSS
jgi:hypothetical protein